MAENVLRAEGIESGYGKVQVLWGAGLAVHRGESVVLLGANGAGKTTLLKVLVGLMPAWRGHVHLAGTDITAPAYRSPRAAGHGLYVGAGRVPRPVDRGEPARSAASSPTGLYCGAASRSCSACSRTSRDAGVPWPARCPAGSARCWGSPRRWRPARNCW